jgi:hypothetical protein|tara:strand:+ start:43 stop:171 length:129 start_codon:yes stop_codon:yes gene_type:complete
MDAKYDKLIRKIMADSNISYSAAEKFLMHQIDYCISGGRWIK